jgi:Tfp pilus assembly protein PilF
LLREQDRAMHGRPGREFALANLGLAYRQLGRGADAERTYRQGLALAPRTDWLWNDFGLLLKGLGRLDEAFQAFVSGMKQEANPGDSAAGTNLGVLFQRTGKSGDREPQVDLQRVVASRPDAAMARRLLLDGLAIRR